MSHNPIIRGKHFCDPHVCAALGKIYLSVGVDKGWTNQTWSIEKWEIYSSEDLFHWKRDCEIKPESFYMGKSECCWASDLTYKTGIFTFIFPIIIAKSASYAAVTVKFRGCPWQSVNP